MASSSKQSAAYDYFAESGEDTYRCLVSISKDKVCAKEFKKSKGTSVVSNLKRHLKRAHVDVSKEVEDLDKASSKKRNVLTPEGTSRRITEFFSSNVTKTTVTVTKNDMQRGILKMVCYDGVPSTFFRGEGFQTLLGQAAKSLNIALGRDAIRELVINVATEERRKLMKSMQGKLLFLKFDGVSRLRSHFLGISVQYWEEEEGIVNRTLSLENAEAKFDAENTKDIILNTLGSFEINKSQILGCVVDNASTMTKTVTLLNDSDPTAFEKDPELDETGMKKRRRVSFNLHYQTVPRYTI